MLIYEVMTRIQEKTMLSTSRHLSERGALLNIDVYGKVETEYSIVETINGDYLTARTTRNLTVLRPWMDGDMPIGFDNQSER